MNRDSGGGTQGACRASGGFDPNVPNVARVYDYVLGGKDNFAADRAFVDKGIRWVPDLPLVVRANRDFLGRVVRHLAADCGIDQFLDIGTGLPTAENVHQVVHRVNPAGRVVYVDNDQVVLTHARALLAGSSNVAVAGGDLRDPEGILRAPQVRELIDYGARQLPGDLARGVSAPSRGACGPVNRPETAESPLPGKCVRRRRRPETRLRLKVGV